MSALIYVEPWFKNGVIHRPLVDTACFLEAEGEGEGGGGGPGEICSYLYILKMTIVNTVPEMEFDEYLRIKLRRFMTVFSSRNIRTCPNSMFKFFMLCQVIFGKETMLAL